MADWRTGTLRDVAAPRGLVGGPFGSSLGGKDYVPSGVPVIRGVNLASHGYFDSSELVFVTPAKARKLSANQALPGDVVFTQRGTLGQVGIVPAEYDNYVVSQSQMRLRVDPVKADPRFVYYQFRSRAMVDTIRNSAITTGVPHINLGILAALPILIPPLRHQVAIAGVLGALDDKIAANEATARTAHDLASADFARADAGASRAGRLGDILDLAYGRALPARLRRAGDVPVFGSAGRVGRHDEALAPGPGIIVGRKGTVGSVHWCAERFFPIDTTYYVRIKRKNVSFPYAYHMLLNLGLDRMNQDSAVPGLNRSHALAVPVRLPPADVIAAFTQRVDPLFALRQRLAEENATLTELRDYLLPRLLTRNVTIDEHRRP
ncbi:restriction endonuclease subunit S [Paractinoplanes rhizophilus]|jgi:type I restriction enzyme S subunit|uniref:Restriction endonuclease subunit S n=1 Tax=Paractinoplanes rhizophilus TaxID=1416877 RepID=A0ABW2HLI5_9ACTN|nr:restriction endonuclease subunit S [Actinoplanes sp.]